MINQLGISREMLRYYESTGLLSPERSENNKYRKYSDMDGFEILRIKMLLSYNTPLKKIRPVMDSQTLDGQIHYLDRQIDQLEERIQRLQQELFRIRKQRSFILDAINIDAIAEMETFGMYRLMMLGEGVAICPSAAQIARDWLSKAPMTEIGWAANWPNEDAFLKDELIPAQIGLLAFPQCIEEANLCTDPPVSYFPPGHSVRIMVKTENPFYIHTASLHPMHEYVRAHHLRVVSGISGRYSGSTCANGNEYFFSARVIVEPQP